jgi:molybdopterin-biosynthesis enzyme MoeA-like protein
MTARRAKRHQETRRKLRRRLEADGVPEAQIERRLDRLRREQEAARRADVARDELDRIHDETWAALRLDDTGFKPTVVDPLQRGAARVTDTTARAARRRKATTRHEHEQGAP